MNNHLVDIIIPTYNNGEYLLPCLRSMLARSGTQGLFKIIVVNNGHKNSCDYVEHEDITVVHTGENLRWEGGITEGLKHSKTPYVMFANDDIFIPTASHMWINRMLEHFHNPKVAAVGPSSNCVMGLQNIWSSPPADIFTSKFLIGFCVLMRRSAFDEIGGMDLALPGGDDFDWSIRLRNAGYLLVVDRSVFVYHHGFKTGERLHGNAAVMNGWNSWEYMQKVNTALIKKHGLKTWYDTMNGAHTPPSIENHASDDTEGDFIRSVVGDTKKVVDLGCGPNKTVSWATGVDMIPEGVEINTLQGAPSQADVVANVEERMPFEDESFDIVIARHILEHCINPITTLREWSRLLTKTGKMCIAVPDHRRANTIPMNMEHVHAYTPENLTDIVELVGLQVEQIHDPENGISFVAVLTK